MSNKNTLVISVDVRETRVALIEDGIIAELHIERRSHQDQGTVGNVYLGKVTRVLPGLQAAFIDIGQERAAFLHVEDLIRPDDFDAYLAGGRKQKTEAVSEEIAEEVSLEAEAAPALTMAGDAHVSGDAILEEESLEEEGLEGEGSEEASGEDGGLEAGASAAETSDASHAQLAVPAAEVSSEVLVSSGDDASPSADVSEADVADSDDSEEDDGDHDADDAESDEDDDSDDSEDEVGGDGDGARAPQAEASVTDVGAAAHQPGDGDDSGPDLFSDAAHAVDAAPSGPSLTGTLGDNDGAGDGFDAPAAAASGAGGAARGQAREPGESRGRPGSRRGGRGGGTGAARAPRPAAPPLDFDGDLPGFTITDPGEPVPRAPAAPRSAPGGGGGGGGGGERSGGRRGRSRRGRGDGAPREGGGQPAQAREGGGGGDRSGGDRGGRSGGRDRNGGRSSGERGRSGGDRSGGDRGGRSGSGTMPNRISKSTPIREVVREGQEIIVQVTKDPIGTKGARCSSHVSLPGRYVVYLPTVDHIGISKRIGSDKERNRLREAIDSMKPPSGGLIVRTVAEGLTKKQLKQDIGYLVRLWGEVAAKKEGARAPHILSSELDLVLKTARDLFTDEVGQIVIDDKRQYERLCHFVEMFAPDRLKDIQYYGGDEPIFDAYGIEDEIQRALSRKVPLPSGGHLVIDQAEALTAIDVNTGRFVGKGSKDMEETIVKTNLEAVNEIAYQLRFRNIGGLIILDLIDMEKHSNREKVRRTLEELLQKDKAKTTLNRISDLGLIEMTRKRTRESLGRLLHEPCFYCDGTGQLQSKETVAYEILREIRRKRNDLTGYTIVVNVHPAVADILGTSEKEAVAEVENRYMRKISVVGRKDYHLEQFDLQGK